MHGFRQQITSISRDPALSLWESQQRARQVSRLLCRVQQRLEGRILVNTGIWGLTDGEASGPTAESAQVHAWPDVDEHAAYQIACEAEVLATTEELRLLDAVPQVAAASLTGVIAKLEMIVGADREIDAPVDFPWPHLTSVLSDLRAIAGCVPTLRPDRAMVRDDIARHWEAGAKLVAALKRQDDRERVNGAG